MAPARWRRLLQACALRPGPPAGVIGPAAPGAPAPRDELPLCCGVCAALASRASRRHRAACCAGWAAAERPPRLPRPPTALPAQLQLVLKLSKEKWDEASAHALQAVQPDFRKRVWYPPGHNMGIGILFGCKYGAVALKDCVMLLQVGCGGGGGGGGAGCMGCWRMGWLAGRGPGRAAAAGRRRQRRPGAARGSWVP